MKAEIILGTLAAGLIFWGGCILGKSLNKTPRVQVNNYPQEEYLTEWQIMKLAIAKTESEFNPLAVGKSGDYGLFQITPIYVKEVNRILGEEKFTHEDAFNAKKSVAMFDIMQNYHNPENDIDRAISSHNPTASSAYSVKVRKNMEWVRNYERIRRCAK